MTHSSLLQTNLLRAEHLRPNVTKHVPSEEILSSFLFLPLPSPLTPLPNSIKWTADQPKDRLV